MSTKTDPTEAEKIMIMVVLVLAGSCLSFIAGMMYESSQHDVVPVFPEVPR